MRKIIFGLKNLLMLRFQEPSLGKHIIRGLVFISLPMDLWTTLQTSPAPVLWKIGFALLTLVPDSVAGIFFGFVEYKICMALRSRQTPD